MNRRCGAARVFFSGFLVFLAVGAQPARSQSNGSLSSETFTAQTIPLVQLGSDSPSASKAALAPWSLSLSFYLDYKARSADLMLEPAGKTYKNGIDVQRAYFQQPAFAELCIQAGSALPGVNGFGVAADAALKPEWRGDYFPTTNLPFASGSYSLEANLLKRSVVYWKSPGIEVGFGRDTVDYNGILEGGLLPSSRIPWYDALKARGTLGRFSLDWMIATIQAVKAWDGKDVPSEAGFSFETDSYPSNPTTIVEVMTRLTWNLGKVDLGVTDHAMLSRYNNRFVLTDFFPLISRHQVGVAQTNNSLVLDASWKAVPSLTVSAQFGLDDVNLNTVGIPDTTTPTIPACVLGAAWEAESPVGRISLYAEGGYTHWLWGNYDGSQDQPNSVNYFARFIYRFPRYSGGGILLPLTSPYGPGAIWAKTHGSVRVFPFGTGAAGAADGRRSAFSLDLGYSFLFLDLNTEANLIDTNVLNNTTTANAPRSINFVASLPVSLEYGPWTARVEPAFVWHDESTAFEIELGLGYTIKAGRR